MTHILKQKSRSHGWNPNKNWSIKKRLFLVNFQRIINKLISIFAPIYYSYTSIYIDQSTCAMEKSQTKVSIIDLYPEAKNPDIQYLEQIVKQYALPEVISLRRTGQLPKSDTQIIIVSGGPGDPADLSEPWTQLFRDWLQGVWDHNLNKANKKQVFLICHSFQMAAALFDLAELSPRKSPAYGVYNIHQTDKGNSDPIFEGLQTPFYAADFRFYQVCTPNLAQFKQMGASILALEKIRPHVPLERAIMAIRFSEDIVGTQFHPEVSPAQMRNRLRDPQREENLLQSYGEGKYEKMLRYLNDTTKMNKTFELILPNFLKLALHRVEEKVLLS